MSRLECDLTWLLLHSVVGQRREKRCVDIEVVTGLARDLA
jgi:hypothetical protein